MKYLWKEFIGPYLYENKMMYILLIIIIIITYLLSALYIPINISYLLNSPTGKFTTDFFKTMKTNTKNGYLYMLIILFVLYCMFDYIREYISCKIHTSAPGIIRIRTLDSLMNSLTHSYTEIQESEIIYLTDALYRGIFNLSSVLFNHILILFVSFIIVSCFYLYKNRNIGLSFIIMNMLVFANVYYLSEYNITHWEIAEDYWKNNCTNLLGDKFKNLLNIIFENTLNKEMKAINDNQNIHHALCLNNYLTYSNCVIFSEVIMYTYLVLFFYYIIKTNQNKSDFSSLIFIILMYYSVLIETLKSGTLFAYNYTKVNMVEEKLKHFIEDESTCENIETIKEIKFENVSFKYNEKSKYIIHHLNLEFKPEKINVLMGKSGSGKSTIMKLILKMYEPTNGNIHYDTRTNESVCIDDIRKNIYYVNQRTTLFDESVIYNFQYGNDYSKDDVVEILKKYDLLSYYDSLENNIESKCGVNGSNLSLGMQKIIMVVRGILKKDKNVLIFDEPLTSLDKNTREKIVDLIIKETKGKTIVIISHDPEILPYADNVIKLN